MPVECIQHLHGVVSALMSERTFILSFWTHTANNYSTNSICVITVLVLIQKNILTYCS